LASQPHGATDALVHLFDEGGGFGGKEYWQMTSVVRLRVDPEDFFDVESCAQPV